MNHTNVKTLLREVSRCIRCGLCKSSCPIFRVREPKWENASPRGKMMLIEAILKGKVNLTKKAVYELYACTLCKRCEETCPCDLKISDSLEIIRTKLVNLKKGPLPAHKKLVQSIERNFNPYHKPHQKRLKWSEKGIERQPNSEVFYFVGCTISYYLPEVAKSTIKILEKTGVKFTVDPEEKCCGSPLLRIGEISLAKKLAEHNVKLIKSSGVEKVLVSCPRCYKTLKIDYPNLLGKPLPFKVLHVSEYFSRLVAEKRLEFRKHVFLKVTYHDSCYLGRHCGIYSEPRTLLKNVFGVEIVEMKKNKEKALCCGGDENVKSAFSSISSAMSEKVVEEALKTGAEVLVDTCPFCELNISENLEKTSTKLKILDLTKILEDALNQDS